MEIVRTMSEIKIARPTDDAGCRRRPADCVVTEVSDTRPSQTWSSSLGTAPRQRCSIGGSGLSVLGAEPAGGYAGERNRVSVADNERRQTLSDARWPRATKLPMSG